MNPIISNIYEKLGTPGLAEAMAEKLSGTEFNSLLLEIFRRRADAVTPATLLKTWTENRFVQPSAVDAVQYRHTELDWLKNAAAAGFTPVTLSPVAPLGACSAFGKAGQNKVLSSIRGTEVMADATNVLALQLAQDFKNNSNKTASIHYCTACRHIRGQYFSAPGFTAHFGVFCMASGGTSRGGLLFETEQINRHIGLLLQFIRPLLPHAALSITFYLKTAEERLHRLLQAQGQAWSGLPCRMEADTENQYYELLQFKIFAQINGREVNIADGGFTNWTQQLLNNRKHRLLISGAGLELLMKMAGQVPAE